MKKTNIQINIIVIVLSLLVILLPLYRTELPELERLFSNDLNQYLLVVLVALVIFLDVKVGIVLALLILVLQINMNTNILSTYKVISNIKKAGGFNKYLDQTKSNVFDIAEKLNITIEELLELVEAKLFESDTDDKALSYKNPLS